MCIQQSLWLRQLKHSPKSKLRVKPSTVQDLSAHSCKKANLITKEQHRCLRFKCRGKSSGAIMFRVKLLFRKTNLAFLNNEWISKLKPQLKLEPILLFGLTKVALFGGCILISNCSQERHQSQTIRPEWKLGCFKSDNVKANWFKRMKNVLTRTKRWHAKNW